jgi:predicted secreted hydrolase
MIKKRFDYYITFIIIILIMFVSLSINSPAKNNKDYLYNFNEGDYNPRSISPKDVSYHPSVDRFTIQWWYFEGIFNDGYNAIVNLILISKYPIGVCISHLNIFHLNNTSDFFAKRTITPLAQFIGNNHYPDIFLRGDNIVDFNQNLYNISGIWRYNLTLEIENHAVDLKFTGLSPGWEGVTIGGLYGPVLPIAEIEGTLNVNDDIIEVRGLGYHEHAHEISFPIKKWGWYWGKIIGENSSVFWGKMMKTRWKEFARASIFSYKNQPFIDIEPEKIQIELNDFKFHKKRFIPTTFSITIKDKDHEIYANVTMTSTQIYYLPFGIFNYWRYVLKINGEISFQGIKETLSNKTQIMELMRFV